jgi:radical SAM superfamily enzyme YgiQ (UPF0313 family)
MSNLGFHFALGLLISEDAVRCERVFWDENSGRLGRSYETGTPLGDFDVIAFSISFEDDYFNVVRVLDAAGIAPFAAERGERDPLVVFGGICAYLNAEPIAPIVDAVLVGEADELLPPFLRTLLAERGNGREVIVRSLARVPGIYVPALIDVERDEAGRLVSFSPQEGVSLPVRCACGSGKLAESIVLSRDAYFSNMFLIEISRGCRRGCRFCAAGHVYGAVRHRSAEQVIERVRGALPFAKRIGLVSASLGDHPEIRRILRELLSMGVEVNVASLRIESVDAELAGLLADCGVRTATLAPEAGTELLRRRIGKGTSDAAILRAVAAASAAGMKTVRLYFMLGLPGETDEDVEAIAGLVRRAQSATSREGRTRITVSLSPFVPKPRTPLQWVPAAGERELREKLATVRRLLSAKPRVQFTSAGPREARREAVLARGGRELAGPIVAVAVQGVPWKAALKRAGVDAERIAGREYDAGELFPWETVDSGPRKDALRLIYEKILPLP